jgi:hypothetical protein
MKSMMGTINENNSAKQKMESLIEELGIKKVLKMIGVDKVSKVLEITPIELFKKYNYNPFEELFTYQEFDYAFQNSISFLNQKHFLIAMKTKSPEEILDFFISSVIDELHDKLIDFDTEKWIIPDTPKLLKIIYGDRIMNKPGYKKLVFLAKNI